MIEQDYAGRPRAAHYGWRYQVAMIWVFARRELRLWAHFRTSFVMDQLSTISNFTIYAIIVSLGANGPQSATFGLRYGTFLVLGLVLNTILATALAAPYMGLLTTWQNNRLEPLLMSPINLPVFITGISSGGAIRAAAQVSIYLIGGGLFLGAFRGLHTGPGGLLALVGIVALSIIGYIGLGLMSASMVYLVDARGGSDPVRMAVEVVAGVASGVYYPVTVLPHWLQWIACLIPQTYALDGIRRVFSTVGSTTAQALPVHKLLTTVSPLTIDIVMLAATAVSWGCLGSFMIKRSLYLARKDGRLSKWR